nr:tetratricopeptide repeat protein [Pseudodesulfovibrio sp.]
MIVKKIIFCLLAVLLLAAVAHAADRLPPLARQALHKAQVNMDDSRFEDAAAVLREYMVQAEESVPVQVYLMLGGVYHKNRDWKRAYATFREGLDAHPSDSMLTRNCAVSCYELELYADAGRFFEKAYKLSMPSQPVLLFHAGSAYYSGEDFKSATRILLNLILQEKKPEKNWVRLAIHACLECGQPKKAESVLRKFLASNPGEAPYWELLAKLYLDSERYEKAASALEICYRVRTPTTKDLERLASLYTYSNAPMLASATLKRAHSGVADTKKGIKVASLYASAGRINEAVQHLARLGSSYAVDRTKGNILYNARRFNEAESALLAAVERDPKAPESLYLLGMCAWEKRDWKGAKVIFSKLAGDKSFARRVKALLSVIDDLEATRREASM